MNKLLLLVVLAIILNAQLPKIKKDSVQHSIIKKPKHIFFKKNDINYPLQHFNLHNVYRDKFSVPFGLLPHESTSENNHFTLNNTFSKSLTSFF